MSGRDGLKINTSIQNLRSIVLRDSFAIGSAGVQGTESNPVKYGYKSGSINQSINSTAIGIFAGHSNQGEYSIAIGYQAGQTDQPSHSIVLNATNQALEPSSGGLYISPVTDNTAIATQYPFLAYNDETKEVVFNYVNQVNLTNELQSLLNLPNPNASSNLAGPFNVGQIQYQNQSSNQWNLVYNGPTDVLGAGTFYYTENILSTNVGSIFSQIGITLTNIGSDWNSKDHVRSWKDVAISSSGQYQVAVTNESGSGFIYTSNDYGNTWTEQSIPIDWKAVAISASGEYQSACGTNNICTSTDFGNTWIVAENISDSSFTFPIRSMTMTASGQYQYACSSQEGGGEGRIWVSDNYGVNWGVIFKIYIDNSTDSSLFLLDFRTIATNADGSKVIVLVGDGTGYISTSGFNTAMTISMFDPQDWSSSVMSIQGQYMLVTSNLGAYLSSNYGASFERISTDNVTCSAMTMSGQYQLIGVDNGDIYISEDYGGSSRYVSIEGVTNITGISMSSFGQYITLSVNNNNIFTSIIGVNTYINPVKYGEASGAINQSIDSTAIGIYAGHLDQQQYAVAIGYQAGQINQGENSIAIGYHAGMIDLPSNSIVLNASDDHLPPIQSGFYVTPVGATSDMPFILGYENSTGLIAQTLIEKTNLSNKLQDLLNIRTDTLAQTGNPFNVSISSYTSQDPIQRKIVYVGPQNDFGEGQFLYTDDILTQNMTTIFSKLCITLSNIGTTWIPSTGNNVWKAVEVSSSGQYQIAVTSGINGDIYISNDYGEIWTSALIINDWSDVAISASGQYQLACNLNSTIWYSNNFGTTFSNIFTEPNNLKFSAISMSANGQYQAATTYANVLSRLEGGLLYVSKNYGQNWLTSGYILDAIDSKPLVRFNYDFTSIYVNADGSRVFFCGTTSFEPIRNVYGFSENIFSSPPVVRSSWATARLYYDDVATIVNGWTCISANIQGQYVLLGSSDGCYTSNDFGNTKTKVPTITGNVTCCTMTASGQYQLIGIESGNIYISEDYGHTWTSKHTEQDWTGIGISSSGQYITVAGNNTPIYTSVSGEMTYNNSIIASSNLVLFNTPIEVDGSATDGSATTSGYYFSTANGGTNLIDASAISQTFTYSIKSKNSVWIDSGANANNSAFITSSDRRAKERFELIDTSTALDIIRKLEPLYYHWKDSKNKLPSIGFVAQDVEKHIPQAVNITKRAIASVSQYGKITLLQGSSWTITLELSHNLNDINNATNKISLYVLSDSNECNLLLPYQIVDDYSISILNYPEKVQIRLNDNVYVYGPEVSDFRVLEKDAIFSFGISAIKKLDQEIEQLKNKISDLENKLI